MHVPLSQQLIIYNGAFSRNGKILRDRTPSIVSGFLFFYNNRGSRTAILFRAPLDSGNLTLARRQCSHCAGLRVRGVARDKQYLLSFSFLAQKHQSIVPQRPCIFIFCLQRSSRNCCAVFTLTPDRAAEESPRRRRFRFRASDGRAH